MGHLLFFPIITHHDFQGTTKFKSSSQAALTTLIEIKKEKWLDYVCDFYEMQEKDVRINILRIFEWGWSASSWLGDNDKKVRSYYNAAEKKKNKLHLYLKGLKDPELTHRRYALKRLVDEDFDISSVIEAVINVLFDSSVKNRWLAAFLLTKVCLKHQGSPFDEAELNSQIRNFSYSLSEIIFRCLVFYPFLICKCVSLYLAFFILFLWAKVFSEFYSEEDVLYFNQEFKCRWEIAHPFFEKKTIKKLLNDEKQYVGK